LPTTLTSSFSDATGLLNGTGTDLQNGSAFAATDAALNGKLGKWVPSLVGDLDTVAALQSPQYTTLLNKTVLISFLDFFETDSQSPPSLTDDTDASIDNQVGFPLTTGGGPQKEISRTRRFTNLLGLPVVLLGKRTGSSEKVNFANVQCPDLSSDADRVYILYRTSDNGNAEYGLFGDRYTSEDGSNVRGVVHVPGGPRESPSTFTMTNNDMLLPFPLEATVGKLVDQSNTAYGDLSNLASLTFDKDADGFEDIKALAKGVFLAPTDEALKAVLTEYGLIASDLLAEPYLTAVRRLLQFHTFPEEAEIQTLDYLLNVLDGDDTKELQASDGWVLLTWVCSHPLPPAAHSSLPAPCHPSA